MIPWIDPVGCGTGGFPLGMMYHVFSVPTKSVPRQLMTALIGSFASETGT
jgi:hypothetical protein